MSLRKMNQVAKLLIRNHRILMSPTRTHWYKDYKPGPYPTTPEERLAAAEKYGLTMKEYKPFADDGAGLGDYPDIEPQSGDSRDPFYPWDNPEHKRNFKEVLHVDHDMIGEDRYDVNYKYRQSLTVLLLQFLTVILGSFTIYYVFENMKMFPGQVPKQYPFHGQTHYTFKLED